MGGAAFRGAQRKSAETVYSHSLHGWQYDTAGDPAGITGAANGFVAEDNELLTDVGIYTLSSDVAYTIRVYGQLGSEPSLLGQQMGTAEQPGFHNVELDQPISLDQGETFYVALETSEGAYAFDASFRIYTAMGTITNPPYDVYSAAAYGESFIRNAGGQWEDFLNYDAFGNLGTEWDDASWNFAITACAVEEIPGDANLDRRVDQQDLAILASHWGDTGVGWREGDFDGDAVVGPADACLLAGAWHHGVDEQHTAVPEPRMLVLLLGLALTALARREVRLPNSRTPSLA